MTSILQSIRGVIVAQSLLAIVAIHGWHRLAVQETAAAAPTATSAARTVESFNSDWRFTRGDPAGGETPGFDDSTWTPVRLPHDWAIAGPFDPKVHGSSGKLPWWGTGWYRKTFTLDAADSGKQVYLDFDGVMAFPQVYVNGQLAGGWDYGYMSFRVDATPHVKFGEPNVVAVRADTRKHGTRWYPGAGIYRKVTLTVCDPVHIGHWATIVTTPEVSDEEATVNVQTTIENHGDTPVDVNVVVLIGYPGLTPCGPVAAEAVQLSVPAAGSATASVPLKVANPKRWDVSDPQLYAAVTAVKVDDKVVDDETTRFGIRTFEFTADDGFHLNGRRVQLYGVCLHHDQGPLGAAFYPRAMERQLEIMREMGVNAIRTSHNAPAPELLDLCDRMGFVVWDECFDKWDTTADRVPADDDRKDDGAKQPYSGRGFGTLVPPLEEYGQKQIRSFVMRDRNHPCVVVWSIGNEIAGGGEGVSPERVRFMSDYVRKYDPTRPVGMACHIPEQADTPMFDALDLTGWNYGRRYAIYRERNPDKPIIYSESASALSTRGFYELPLPTAKAEFSDAMLVDSYDFNSARWSDIADVEFDLLQRDKFVAGEFVWTGFDYIGEPTPFDKQARSSYFGIVDLCGIPKDRYYLYRSYWRPDVATVHILPHWNWPERVGQTVPVFVYTNGDSAELFLNGKSLGRRTKARDVARQSDVAEGKPATASSARPGDRNTAAMANDGDTGTGWRAEKNEAGQWWQVDLGSVQPISDFVASLEGGVRDRHYAIKTSDDGTHWETRVAMDQWKDEWGDKVYHGVKCDARYVRFEFTELRGDAQAGVRDVHIYPQPYYAVTDKYRLRWMDVVYEPGELRAVAYQDGREIGDAVMRTAGPPASIRLTPDRSQLAASGEDLCYLLVEALDAHGTLCPLADNSIRFRVEGPAEIAGVGNGNPMSLEPHQADHIKLFYGKALLILRTAEGQGGDIRVTAECDPLQPAAVTVRSKKGDILLY